MITLLLALLLIALTPPAGLGALVLWHIARPQRLPADASNRINKIRCIWFVLTREDLLAPHIPWLRRDELDNVSGEGTR